MELNQKHIKWGDIDHTTDTGYLLSHEYCSDPETKPNLKVYAIHLSAFVEDMDNNPSISRYILMIKHQK